MAIKMDKKRHPPSFHHPASQLRNSVIDSRRRKGKKMLDSRAYPRERCEAKKGCTRSYSSAPSITSQGCRWSIKT